METKKPRVWRPRFFEGSVDARPWQAAGIGKTGSVTSSNYRRLSAPTSSQSPPNVPQAGFTKISNDMISSRGLTDSEYRLLSALKSFAWEKADCYPSNETLAQRCGWYGRGQGKPAVSKVKANLSSLEEKGVIQCRYLHEKPGSPRTNIAIRWGAKTGLDLGHPHSQDSGSDRPKIRLLEPAEIQAGTGLDLGHKEDSIQEDSGIEESQSSVVKTTELASLDEKKPEESQSDVQAIGRTWQTIDGWYKARTPRTQKDVDALIEECTVEVVAESVKITQRDMENGKSIRYPVCYVRRIARTLKAEGGSHGEVIVRTGKLSKADQRAATSRRIGNLFRPSKAE